MKSRDLALIDKALIDVGVSVEERVRMYKTLAAIIHLGCLNFEEDPSIEGCQIATATRIHFMYAAQLLGIEQRVFEEYLLKKKMEVKGSEPILYVSALISFFSV